MLTAMLRRARALRDSLSSGLRRSWAGLLCRIGRACDTACRRWRGLVTGAFTWWASAVRRVRLDGIGRAARAWVRPSTAAALEARDLPVATAAAVCLVVAATAAGARAGLRPSPAAWSYTAGFAVWSAARLAVMRVLAPSANVRPAAATVAWAVSLPPFALAVVPGLGFAAFGLSALLAARALASVGASRRNAARLTAWAYGGHAAGAAIAALATAALAG